MQTWNAWSGSGAPAVVAQWPAPQWPAAEWSGPDGAPTVLLYAHHDVHPTGGDEHWTSPPFQPAERDGRLYDRGAADDKAGVMTHLAVLQAYRDLAGGPPVGVTLFVEGEEEPGSPTLPALLREHHDVRLVAASPRPTAMPSWRHLEMFGRVVLAEVLLLDELVPTQYRRGGVGDADEQGDQDVVGQSSVQDPSGAIETTPQAVLASAGSRQNPQTGDNTPHHQPATTPTQAQSTAAETSPASTKSVPHMRPTLPGLPESLRKVCG